MLRSHDRTLEITAAIMSAAAVAAARVVALAAAIVITLIAAAAAAPTRDLERRITQSVAHCAYNLARRFTAWTDSSRL
jgi:hypothetical protein